MLCDNSDNTARAVRWAGERRQAAIAASSFMKVGHVDPDLVRRVDVFADSPETTALAEQMRGAMYTVNRSVRL